MDAGQVGLQILAVLFCFVPGFSLSDVQVTVAPKCSPAICTPTHLYIHSRGRQSGSQQPSPVQTTCTVESGELIQAKLCNTLQVKPCDIVQAKGVQFQSRRAGVFEGFCFNQLPCMC